MPQLSQQFFHTILLMEGGYQNFPNDKGNYACGNQVGTNRGISAIAYQEYTGRCPTVADMQAINDAFAWPFYNWYWSRFRIDEIEDIDIANLVMNNFMGAPLYAAKAVQRAMNTFGFGLAEDGAMGSKTLAAINNATIQNKASAYNAIRQEWLSYLQNVTWAKALTDRVNRHFPEWPASTGSQEVSVGVGFQEARIKSAFRGASKGELSDLLFLLLLLAALSVIIGISIIAISKLQTT